MRSSQRSADAYLPLEEFVNQGILVKINWNKNTMAAMIRAEVLIGSVDPGHKYYLTSWNNILRALEYRNLLCMEKIIDITKLPKWE